MEFRYDVRLLAEGGDLGEGAIRRHCEEEGAGDGEAVKIHFHADEPWNVLRHCAGLGEIFDVAVENTARRARGSEG